MKKVEAKLGVPIDEQRLIFSGKQLEKSERLADYPQLGPRSTIFLVLRLPGGAELELSIRARKPSRRLPKSDEPCMICYCNEGDDPPLTMPCNQGKHTAMHPYCLMMFSWNEVFDGKKSEIACPQCQTNWELDVIKKYGVASERETHLLSEGLSENFIQNDKNIVECPGCKSFCERINKTLPRVRCRICAKEGKNPEFCWYCLQGWKNQSSNTDCSNPSCNSSGVVAQIQKAPLKKIVGVMSPSIRLCPNCGTALEHRQGCKQFQCKACHCNFCFICLRTKKDGSWQCGSYNTKCVPAPIQERVPSK